MTHRLHLAVALTLTGVGATAVVVLLLLGHAAGALYAVIALLVVQQGWGCVPVRRPGPTASPSGLTITRTTRGPDDG